MKQLAIAGAPLVGKTTLIESWVTQKLVLGSVHTLERQRTVDGACISETGGHYHTLLTGSHVFIYDSCESFAYLSNIADVVAIVAYSRSGDVLDRIAKLGIDAAALLKCPFLTVTFDMESINKCFALLKSFVFSTAGHHFPPVHTQTQEPIPTQIQGSGPESIVDILRRRDECWEQYQTWDNRSKVNGKLHALMTDLDNMQMGQVTKM